MTVNFSHNESLILAALYGRPDQATRAYRAWRRTVPLDRIDGATYRIMPMLVEAAKRQPERDPELPRMRGVAKSVWLANVVRLNGLLPLLSAFESHGMEALLIKGAALFARDADRMGLRCTYDFDVLLRRRDLLGALKIAEAAGYCQRGVRADRFTEADFLALHAVMVERDKTENFELHWWPTPHLHDEGYVDGLFERCETLALVGNKVRVPSLADHLALSLMRAHGDRLDWALDTHWLISRHENAIDWLQFVNLMVQQRHLYKAYRYMTALREKSKAPIPEWVTAQLRSQYHPLERIEYAVIENDVFKETPIKKFVFDCTAVVFKDDELKKVSGLARTAMRVAWRRDTRQRIVRAARSRFKKPDLGLRAVWRTGTELVIAPGDEPIVYGQGWSLPDEVGRWSMDRVAVMAARVDAPSRSDCELTVVVRPFLPAGRTQFRLNYCVDGLNIHNAVLDATAGFPVRWSLCAPIIGSCGRFVVFALELIDAGRPIDFGISPDDRPLGINIETIELQQPVNGAAVSCAAQRGNP